ncbi:hypothetical protein C8R46DRAFT_1221683 [Mycena filopes]|nr:hypothetical protein C8R46DRAFT_1221683 [Mycena filopes]
MATPSNPNTIFTPDQEMEVLLSKLSALSRCEAIPRVIRAQVDAQVRAEVDAILEGAPPARVFYRTAAPTPDEMDARYPAGPNDDVPHYVVCIGRVPGLYLSWQAAADQVNGVPDMRRKKKGSREEGLRYYREQAALGMTQTVTEVEPEVEPASAPPPVAPAAIAGGRSYVSFGGVEVSVCIT